MPENATTRWFGVHFNQLHPLLQHLHRYGGVLRGDVDILAKGWLGRRLARRMGISLEPRRQGFRVEISHDAGVMTWRRCFDDGTILTSMFRPVGHYPDGYWVEQTGPVRLKLGVDVAEGGWRWRLLGVRVGSVPLPLAIFPQVSAGKHIDANGCYRFEVAFALFGFGTLMRYGGTLRAT